MNIHFYIDYSTVFGQELVLNVVEGAQSADEHVAQYRMQTADGLRWEYNLRLGRKRPLQICYFYSLEQAGMSARREWAVQPHLLTLSAQKAQEITVYDHWNDIPFDSYLYSSAFTDCIHHRPTAPLQANAFGQVVRLQVLAPQLTDSQRLVCVGADKVLGEWDVKRALPMMEQQTNEWVVDIDATQLEGRRLEFKFAAVSGDHREYVTWESADNRVVELPLLGNGQAVVYALPQAFFNIEECRLAGTLVPVFSLRTRGSFGVGDFGDLKQMIDWVAQTGQRALQVLPINDSTTTHTWTDSYPYSCISIFALHPQYADLRQLPPLKDTKQRNKFERLQAELNGLDKIDYERVNNAKTEYLMLIYQQEMAKIRRSTAFKQFFDKNQQWLVPYAQYCSLREKNGTAEFLTWKSHQQWNERDRKALSDPTAKEYQEVEFYYFVQFVLYSQMQAAHEHAREKKVVLKGDIPIGVNRYGCDVWMEPKYFNLNGQAGAPPDDFSVNGQNWGFPTYNWDAMIADGCQWWVRRFQNMAQFFDAYRIDHVLGFFRIWEIPIESVHGLLGQFSPSLGMSPEEIEAYGLAWQEEQYTRPFIADWVLDRVFHELKAEVIEQFLDHAHDDIYTLKPAFDTQRKIEAYFEPLIAAEQGKSNIGKRESELDKLIWLRDGLYALVSDVLFVRDRKDANKFHPRITAQLDFVYEALWDSDKEAFNRIYNDYYYRRNNQFWYNEAMKKLPRLVEATRMLVCAEDLGMVPDCVAWVMDQLRILSLELQSMPKDPSVRFGYLERNPYRSVCTISSHDMPTLRQWWDENPDRTQTYYNTMLYREGAAPHPLPGWLAHDIIARHLASPSMLCILSIQDWLAIDEQLRLANPDAERINIPANPKHYWRYRMHLNIEDLQQNNEFNAHMRQLISQSGRNI